MTADVSTSTWEDLHVRSARDLYASVPVFAKCGTHPAIAALTAPVSHCMAPRYGPGP